MAEGRVVGELEARFALARALVAAGGDLARARGEAAAARLGFAAIENITGVDTRSTRG